MNNKSLPSVTLWYFLFILDHVYFPFFDATLTTDFKSATSSFCSHNSALDNPEVLRLILVSRVEAEDESCIPDIL